MPTKVIEENKSFTQVRLTCDSCGKYIGTRIMLKSEVEIKQQKPLVCFECESKPKQPSVFLNVDQQEIRMM